jgi:acyl-CoA synthetase (AMP-forming)/AMP-acid ligase II
LFYTSGTTGRPKGAMLSHRNLERMTVNCLADICSFRPRETVLHVAPFSHGSGLYLLPALARQTTNLISESFVAADVLDVVGRERVSVIAFMAPTMIVMLLAAPPGEDISSLRCVIYGGAPLHVEHARAALRRFGQVFVQLYGQGEAPMTISYLPADDHIADDGEALATAGIPRTDVEVRIVDADDLEVERGSIGEVCARGDVVMEGYWRNPEATARTLRGGWLHTGDLGYLDSKGRLVLVDRMNDVIITGGSNVYPREVEEVLLRHPGIAEAAVFATPDPLWGEVVSAAVVTRPNCRLDADDILEHCRDHIASFKKPRHIHFVESLPKNSYGKVLRTALRETATTGEETAT